MTTPPTVTRAAADIGGTFTDVAVLTPTGGSPPESSLSEQSDAGTPASAGPALLCLQRTNTLPAPWARDMRFERFPTRSIARSGNGPSGDEESLDAVVVDAIRAWPGADVSSPSTRPRRLDRDVAGGPEFDRAIADFERIDHRHNHQQRRRQP